MTATQPATTVPWKVRWAVATVAAALVLTMPGAVRDIGLRAIHNTAHIFGMDGNDPIELSPTNPPVVNP